MTGDATSALVRATRRRKRTLQGRRWCSSCTHAERRGGPDASSGASARFSTSPLLPFHLREQTEDDCPPCLVLLPGRSSPPNSLGLWQKTTTAKGTSSRS
jgi:hypothetical protein